MTDAPPALNREFEQYDQVRRGTPIAWPSMTPTSSTRTIEIATLDFGRFLHGDAGTRRASRRISRLR